MKLVLKIVYDGSAYHGFQYQPNAKSIQGVLTDAVSAAFGLPCTVTGCSRTDAGVHALGYCAAVEPAEKAERNAPVLTHEVSAPADLFNIYLYLGKEQEKHNKENAVR